MSSRYDFVPVVMAGGEGSPMVPLTDSKLKCLLPIGNVPLIYFTIELIERSGFNFVYIFTKQPYRITIERSLKLIFPKMTIHYITYDHSQGEEGTGIFLRHILTKIPYCENIIIFGGDLYGYIDSLQDFICDFRTKDAVFSALLSKAVPSFNNKKYPQVYKQARDKNIEAINSLINNQKKNNGNSLEPIRSKAQKISLSLNQSYFLNGSFDYDIADLDHNRINYVNSKEIILIEPRTNQLLFMLNEEEIDEEGIDIDHEFISVFQRFNIFYNLHDLHIYAFKTNYLIEINNQKQYFNSIRSNFIPYILRKQISNTNKCLVSKFTINDQPDPITTVIDDNDDEFSKYDPVNSINTDIFFSYAYAHNISSVIDHFNSYDDESHKYFYKTPYERRSAPNKSFCTIIDQNNTIFRVNSMEAFKYACYDIHNLKTLFPIFYEKLQTAYKRVQQIPKFFNDNIIDRNVYVSDDCREFINQCIIGNNVTIGENCYMKNCVVFNNVTIGSDCHIEESIICNQTNIGSNSSIVKCIVGSKQEVPPKTDITDEIYIGTMMILTED